LGAHFLSGCECNCPSPERLDLGAHRPEALLSDINSDVHDQFAVLRHRPKFAHLDSLSRAAGIGWGRIATHNPGNPRRCVPERTDCLGLHALFRGDRPGSDPWTRAGRLAQRQLGLAMDLLPESPLWPRGYLLNRALQPETETNRHKGAPIDYPGLLGIGIGLGCLEYVLDRGERLDWFASPAITAAAIASFAAIVLLVYYELFRTSHPILQLGLLANRNFALASGIIFFTYFARYGSTALLPEFTHAMLGYTATNSGLVLSPGSLALLVFLPTTTWLMKRVDLRALIFSGLMVTTFAFHLLSSISLAVDYRTIVQLRILESTGVALFLTPVSVLAFATQVREEQCGGITLWALSQPRVRHWRLRGQHNAGTPCRGASNVSCPEPDGVLAPTFCGDPCTSLLAADLGQEFTHGRRHACTRPYRWGDQSAGYCTHLHGLLSGSDVDFGCACPHRPSLCSSATTKTSRYFRSVSLIAT
jgi:hypothetical protein